MRPATLWGLDTEKAPLPRKTGGVARLHRASLLALCASLT
jgi:hypothetical protein